MGRRSRKYADQVLSPPFPIAASGHFLPPVAGVVNGLVPSLRPASRTVSAAPRRKPRKPLKGYWKTPLPAPSIASMKTNTSVSVRGSSSSPTGLEGSARGAACLPKVLYRDRVYSIALAGTEAPGAVVSYLPRIPGGRAPPFGRGSQLWYNRMCWCIPAGGAGQRSLRAGAAFGDPSAGARVAAPVKHWGGK